MRIGFHAPLPPERTGVAEYAAALLGALPEAALGVDGDANLYHLGNNQLHAAIYRRALERPGVVVLHDAVLQHFFLGAFDRDAYLAEFVYNYGEWMRSLAEDLWRNRARSATDARYFAYPMLKRIAERSLAVVVHNPAAARRVREHAPATRVVEIPHPVLPAPQPAACDVIRLRAALGVPASRLLAGVFGYLRESKRLAAILRAFHRALNRGADVALLIAGSFASNDLERALAGQLDHPRILRLPYLEEPAFTHHAAATDVCLNLRYPSAGETSGIAIRLMALAKPVIFTAGEEIARLPEGSFLALEPGPGEEELLADYLVWLASSLQAAALLGARASAHVREHHALERVADSYRAVLREVLVSIKSNKI